MVIYDLICELDHEFEGWFKDSDDMAMQQNSKLLRCPYCDTLNIIKKPTAAKLAKKSNSVSLTNSVEPNLVMGNADDSNDFQQVKQLLNQVEDYIEHNFEDVGNKFTDEAISIHRGEKDPANIRGTASKEELKKLKEEGVQTVIMPPKPIDKKKFN